MHTSPCCCIETTTSRRALISKQHPYIHKKLHTLYVHLMHTQTRVLMHIQMYIYHMNRSPVAVRECMSVYRENYGNWEKLHNSWHIANTEHYRPSHKVYSSITGCLHIFRSADFGMLLNRVVRYPQTVCVCYLLIPSINHKEVGMESECSDNVWLVASLTFDTGGSSPYVNTDMHVYVIDTVCRLGLGEGECCSLQLVCLMLLSRHYTALLVI